MKTEKYHLLQGIKKFFSGLFEIIMFVGNYTLKFIMALGKWSWNNSERISKKFDNMGKEYKDNNYQKHLYKKSRGKK